ncbi:class I SAM-dependent methyltransferase [Candidatus Beckwithbacteria bacterium]|nr:class I SAM-dependent methyltransferase [Candidatus Beckwithbacteria bacterium]
MVGPKLQESNVDANIVDLDLKFDPVGGNFAVPIVKAIDYVRSKLDQSGKPYEKLTKARRYVGGIEDRKFIQGDGRNLPFADETFDMSMALWSTYQIPDGAKESVFREIMRVSNTIHLGPIFKKDYELLQSLAEELNFEIVVCHPFTIASEIRSLEEMDPLLKIDGVRSEFETFLSKVSKTVEEDNFKAQKDADYQNYINQNEVDKRIVKPKEENSKVVRIFDVPVLATGEGSSFMVLRRKKE